MNGRYITYIDADLADRVSTSTIWLWLEHEFTHHIFYNPATGQNVVDHLSDDFRTKQNALHSARRSKCPN